MELNNITNTGTWSEQATRLNDNFNKVALGIDTLQSAYQSLSKSAIEVVDTLPQTGEANKIYRLVGTTSYTDYMYNADDLTTPIPMATYNNSIDNVPTAGSDNLVKSGGVYNELALGAVYDVSAKNPTAGSNNDGKWESISVLLSDANLNTLIPTSVRKGGMSIKFVQTSDNKYVQYRLMADEFTTDVTKWAICDDEVLVNDPIYIDAKIDSAGNLLEGTKKDNTKRFTGDLQVDGHIINTELQNSIDGKVTSEEGKSLIDSGVAQSNFTIDNPEWLDVVLDNDNNIVEGILRRGEKVQNLPVETPFSEESYEENPEYIEVDIAPNGTILESLSKDGKKYVAGISERLESIDKTVQYYHRIYPHNAIVSFIDDDTGIHTPEIWGRIINATDIRMGFACVTGIMGHEPGVEIPSMLTPMSLENLQAFYDAGHEVYSHSWSHPSFRDANLDTINEECRKSRDWLNEHGFTRNSDVIVYPGGMGTSDTDKFDVVRRNYMYGVDTYGNYDYYGYATGVNPEPFINDLAIARCNGDTLSLSELKDRFDIAVRDKKLFVVMNHSYELNTDKENQIAKLISFIEYIQSTSAVILPLQEAIHQIYGWH